MCGNMKSKASFLCVVQISVATHFLLWNKSKEIAVMEDYKSMYFKLFNQITDIIEQLKEIQATTEEMYINANSDDNDK